MSGSKFWNIENDENRQERSEADAEKKSHDPASIWTQDLLNSSQTLLPTELLGSDGRGV